MPDNISPDALLEQISAFIRLSLEHVSGGGDVNLDGLDEKVQQLCNAVAALPKEQARGYEPKLLDLSHDLDVLKRGMELAQAELRAQLGALELRHKAVKAYTDKPE